MKFAGQPWELVPAGPGVREELAEGSSLLQFGKRPEPARRSLDEGRPSQGNDY